MISVIIPVFGDSRWRDLAWSRAHPSATRQGLFDPRIGWLTPEVCVVEGQSLAHARNTGAVAAATSPWLCFLDADDELAPGYLEAMRAAITAEGFPPRPMLFTPRVQYVTTSRRGERAEPPRFWPEVPVEDGNWLVIGTVVPRDLFLRVGGFEDWPKYEDWACFARMQKAGASVVKVPGAVYRAYRNPHGRNQEGGRNAKQAAHDMIRRAVFPELYEQTA